MRILKTAIIPVIGLLSLAMLGTAQAIPPPLAPAVREYANSNNYVVIGDETTVGSLTGTTAYGLRFSGTNYGVSNGNIVRNHGTIISGTGLGRVGAAGIFFDASNNGQSNGNTVINYGTIIGLDTNSLRYYGGILFSCLNNGDTKYNLVMNEGSILASGSFGTGVGIGFVTQNATSANSNTIINDGLINVNFIQGSAVGIGFDAGDSGDASGNTVVNRGRIEVFAPAGQAVGIAFSALYSGSCNNNFITNYGSISVSGSQATGIYVSGSNNGTAAGNVINNWGAISVSSGGTAIQIINGNNNVITLSGHSSVNGPITASGTNNVLNLAFTGMSSQAAEKLRAQINGQTSGAFTVRGVTYTYDPLIVNIDVSSYEKQGRTPNQRAVGANLDSFKVNPTGDMLRLLNALDQSGNVPRGLEQLSPQRYQVYTDIALANADFFTQEIDQRLDNLRIGSESIDTSRLGISSSSIQSKLGMSDHKQVLASATMNKSGKSVELKETAPEEKRWGAFLSGDVIFANVDGRDWQQDAGFTTAGVLAGVDAKVCDTLTAGLLLGYNHADADLDKQNSGTTVETYSTGAYAGYREGNYYGNGLFTYSRNNYDSGRTIDLPGLSRNANGSTSGSQYVLNIDGGYDHSINKDLTVGPFAGLQYVNLGVDSFTEHGAGAANLALNDQGVNSLRSRLGVRMELRREISTHWVGASEVRVAWQHEFLNNDRAIVAQFSGSGLGSFAVRTDDPERNAALVGLGINATYKETLTTFADYDVQAGQAHYLEQIVKAGFKWSF